MKPWLIALLLFVMSAGALAAETPAEHAAKGAYLGAKSTEYPAWFKESFLDLRDDLAEAGKQGRRVMLMFTQDNCPYCNLLVERNLSQRDTEALLRDKFEVIALNMWGDRPVTGVDGHVLSEKAFAKSLKVQFTPILVFFDEAGRVILRLNGYVPPARFKVALDWVAEHREKQQPFRDYVAAREGAGSEAAGKGELIAEDFFLKSAADLRRRGKAARPLAVFFEQKDCPDCETLHRRVLADPELRVLLARFDNAQLDLWSRAPITTPDGQRTTARDWARQLDVKYAPGIVLFDSRGKEIIRWESSFRVFHTVGMFDYVLSGAWRQEPEFQRYLSSRGDRIRETGRAINIWRYADEPVTPKP